MKKIKFKGVSATLSVGLLAAAISLSSCLKTIPEYDVVKESLIASDVNLNVSTDLQLAVGMTEYVEADLYPNSLDYDEILWSTNNKYIATVEKDANSSCNAYINALYKGSTSINLKQKNSFFFLKTIYVTIVDAPESIALDSGTNRIELFQNVSINLASRIIPTPEGTYTGVDCVIEDPTVASYKNGVLRAELAGKTKLTITSRAPNSDEINTIEAVLTVNNPVPLTGLELEPVLFPISPGEFYTLRVDVDSEDGNATRDLVGWESSNPAAVSISGDGVITGVTAGGTSTITAYDAAAGKDVLSRSITVNVGYEGMQSLTFAEATNPANLDAMGFILSSENAQVDYSKAESEGYITISNTVDYNAGAVYKHPITKDSRVQYKNYPYMAVKVGWDNPVSVNTFDWECWTGNLGRIWLSTYSKYEDCYYYKDAADETSFSGSKVTPQIYMINFSDDYFTAGNGSFTDYVEHPITSDEIIDANNGSQWHLALNRTIIDGEKKTASTDEDGDGINDTPVTTVNGTSVKLYWAHFFKTEADMLKFIEAEEKYWEEKTN